MGIASSWLCNEGKDVCFPILYQQSRLVGWEFILNTWDYICPLEAFLLRKGLIALLITSSNLGSLPLIYMQQSKELSVIA